MHNAAAMATALGLGFSTGLNTYATLLVYGLLARFFPGSEPGELATFFASTPALIGLGVMYAIEFAADKIPAVDHVWDAIHTFVRPIGGAVAALAATSSMPIGWQVMAAAMGGSLSLVAHGGKAGTRIASTAITGGTANWALSLVEDVVAVVQTILAVFLPVVAAVCLLFLLGISVWLWRRWHRRPAAAAAV